jgi:putative hydrolase of the HAD superfamily
MTLNGTFSNIIFDLGGVILNIDPKQTVNQFKNIGFDDILNFLDYYRSRGFMADFQIGQISTGDFCDEIRKHSKIELSNDAIINAWNATLLDFPENRIMKLMELGKKYRIFLLSNTNIIHYHNFANRLPIVGSIDSIFEKVYYSHEIGLSKPDIAAYQHVLTQNGLKASETLFLDDLSENIEAAASIGMQTRQVTDADLWPTWFDECK